MNVTTGSRWRSQACTTEVIVVRAEARSFLHHQVRSMVGSLKKVGEGRWPPAKVGEALAVLGGNLDRFAQAQAVGLGGSGALLDFLGESVTLKAEHEQQPRPPPPRSLFGAGLIGFCRGSLVRRLYRVPARGRRRRRARR